MSVDEAELVRRAQEGDHAAWRSIVQLHAPRLAAYLGARLRRPDVVDTLVAESIYAAWRHLDRLDDPARFPAWFRRVGANLAMRWRARHRDEPLSGAFPVERCGDDPALRAEMERLERALGELDEQHRMALEQRFRGGLDGAALAEALHCSPAESDALVEEALARLEALLAEQEPAP